MTDAEREQAISNLLVSEKCSCGHLRAAHTDRLGGLARGHGDCRIEHCDCARFTWAGRV